MVTIARSPTRRISELAEAVSWQLQGLFETDAVRPIKFGLRDLAQRKEIRERAHWAKELTEEPRTFSLDRSIGFATNPFGSRIDLEPICHLGAALGRSIEAKSSNSSKGFHINHLLPSDRASIDTMLAVALEDELLRAVTAYLGIVPVLGDMDFFCSLPTPEGTAFSKSQLYHCDNTSLTQLKFFVYTGDVSAHDGPLEVIDAARSQEVRDRVHYRYGSGASRVSDATMSAHVPPEHQHSFLGPRGTSFLVDTARCFHRGSRIRQSDARRMVAVFQFVPPHCTQLPLRLRKGAPFAQLVAPGMTSLARAVLGEPITLT